MYNAKHMYIKAIALAIAKGPGAIPVNGSLTACYYLDRDAVEDLFEDNFYNLNRSTWRSALDRWQKKFGVIVPDTAMDPNYRGNWFVIFTFINKNEQMAVRLFAEKEGVPKYIPSVAEGVASA